MPTILREVRRVAEVLGRDGLDDLGLHAAHPERHAVVQARRQYLLRRLKPQLGFIKCPVRRGAQWARYHTRVRRGVVEGVGLRHLHHVAQLRFDVGLCELHAMQGRSVGSKWQGDVGRRLHSP